MTHRVAWGMSQFGLVYERKGKWIRFYGPKANPQEIAEVCKKCKQESLKGKPSSIAMNCWKIVIEFEEEKRKMVEEWIKDAIKKYPKLTGELSNDNVLILYFQSGWNSMWKFREYMVNEWCIRGLLPVKGRYFIPYRRGGSYYDSKFGSWRYWGKNYYSDKVDYSLVNEVKAECPYDGALLEWDNTKLICPLCGLVIPLGVIYEVLENGVAEYEVKSGPRSGKIYRVALMDKRLIVEEVNPCSERG